MNPLFSNACELACSSRQTKAPLHSPISMPTDMRAASEPGIFGRRGKIPNPTPVVVPPRKSHVAELLSRLTTSTASSRSKANAQTKRKPFENSPQTTIHPLAAQPQSSIFARLHFNTPSSQGRPNISRPILPEQNEQIFASRLRRPTATTTTTMPNGTTATLLSAKAPGLGVKAGAVPAAATTAVSTATATATAAAPAKAAPARNSPKPSRNGSPATENKKVRRPAAGRASALGRTTALGRSSALGHRTQGYHRVQELKQKVSELEQMMVQNRHDRELLVQQAARIRELEDQLSIHENEPLTPNSPTMSVISAGAASTAPSSASNSRSASGAHGNGSTPNLNGTASFALSGRRDSQSRKSQHRNSQFSVRTALNDKMEREAERLREKEERLRIREERLARAEAEAKAAAADAKAATAEKELLQKKLSQAESLRMWESQRVESLHEELDTVRTSRDNLQRQVGGFQVSQRTLEKQLVMAQRDARRAKRVISALEANVHDLKITVEEKNMENDELNRSITRVMQQAASVLEGPHRISGSSDNSMDSYISDRRPTPPL